MYPLVCEVCILFHPCYPYSLHQAQQIRKLPGPMILMVLLYEFLPLYIFATLHDVPSALG